MSKTPYTHESMPVVRFSRPWWTGDVQNKYGDLALLVCSFVTGLLDCAAFNNWGVFVGMMTGNTVILCLSSASLPLSAPYSYATTSVSLVSYLVGAFATFQLCGYFGKMRRLTVASSFFVQGCLIILAAALITAGLAPVDHDSAGNVLDNVRIVTAIPPLAFQSGAQIAQSRMLAFNELPVNVLTSTYADLMGDPKLFARRNVKRDRRVLSVLCLVAGALCSTWIMKRGPGIEVVLWIGAGLKLVTAVGLCAFMVPVEPVVEMKQSVL